MRTASLGLVQKLRDANLSCEFPLTPAKSDKQFKRAQELGVMFTVRLEATPGRLKLRNLVDRRDESLEVDQAIEIMRRM